jgi:hypothetical protein
MPAHRLQATLVAAILLVALSGTSASCSVGCPTALASGVLTASGTDLLLTDDTGAPMDVVWPDGYSVRRDGDALALVNRFGFVMAREGDRIDMGGGVGTDDRFHGCNDIVVRAPAS